MMERRSAHKPVNTMDRLADMGHFPAAVNAGATVNVLLTLCITWWLEGLTQQRLTASTADILFRFGGPDHTANTAGALRALQFWSLAVPLVWAGFVLALNLAPVAALRLRMSQTTPYPPLAQMNFVTDQHKFSDWVYLAASANMAFWVLLGWVVFTWAHTLTSLAAMLVLAALATFSPVFLRGTQTEQRSDS